jgi:succinyl-diaminopimelate desuccinylase
LTAKLWHSACIIVCKTNSSPSILQTVYTMVNKKRLIKLTRNLISINSENPPGDEFCIGRFIKKYLNNLGIDAKIYEFKNRRYNVVAHLNGRDNRCSLLVTPHLDTVPAGNNWKRNPFAGKIYKDKIYGLGATDCKGNLACALESINSIVEDGVVLNYNLIFAATADEESGSALGLISLLSKGILRPDAAVILDAEDFEIIVTQKGLMHLKIKIKGRRSHGAYPWRGINAIDIAIGIIREIKEHKFRYIKNKYLRPPTVNIGTIKGGDKVNIVADWCEFELDFRFLPGMQAKDLLRDVKCIIKKHTQEFKIEIESIQAPYSINETHPLVTYLKNSMRELNIKPAIKGSEGATVITFFQRKNIPAVACGFGSSGCAHTVDEYVKIDNLYKGTYLLEQFLKDYKFS